MYSSTKHASHMLWQVDLFNQVQKKYLHIIKQNFVIFIIRFSALIILSQKKKEN